MGGTACWKPRGISTADGVFGDTHVQSIFAVYAIWQATARQINFLLQHFYFSQSGTLLVLASPTGFPWLFYQNTEGKGLSGSSLTTIDLVEPRYCRKIYPDVNRMASLSC